MRAGLLSTGVMFALASPVMLALASPAQATPRWETLPALPEMPTAKVMGHVEAAGAKIYYATYGKGPAVVLLHGGMGNGDHFVHQVRALSSAFRVVIVDSRGQGRSTGSTSRKAPLSYHAMADDVLAVLDELELPRAALVGWSDGGAIALDLAVHHPARVSRLFVIGTNYDAHGLKPRKGKPQAKTFVDYNARCRADHLRFGGTAKTFRAALDALLPVWRRRTVVTRAQLRAIKAPTVVALGDHDEIIQRAHVEEMARLIPGATFRLFARASHFAIWQDPEAFNAAVVEFLTAKTE